MTTQHPDALFPDTQSHVLRLVSTALDEFETASLGSSVRRAYRIARLRGDSRDAFRLGLELGIRAEAPDVDQSSPGDEDQSWIDAEWFAFLRSRTADVEAKLLGHREGGAVRYTLPVDELIIVEPAYQSELSLETRMETDNRRRVVDRMLAEIRNLAYRYLIGCETELRLSVSGERMFGKHRSRVDRVLGETAPDVLDKLSSAIRRAGESDHAEARAQALTSCRRVLVAVADLLYPPSETPHVDGQGKERLVGAEQYRNRILAYLETTGSTHSKALRAAIVEFANRLDGLDELTQKGVHAEVSEQEMEFGIVQTYLLSGELLSIELGKES